MKKKSYFLALGLAVWVGFTLAESTQEALLNRARDAARLLGKTLKSKLVNALQEDNLAGAVVVCRDTAPHIAEMISKEQNVFVRRISDKTRNPDNQPLPWEAKGYSALRQMLEDGVEPGQAEWFETAANEDGEMQLHYLKAIMTEAICLTCHGQILDHELASTLTRYYPGDQATGYGVNELRGAFSVVIPVSIPGN